MNLNDALLAQNSVIYHSGAVNADDPTQRNFVGMVIEYVGSAESCLITTAANNSIASAVGVLSSEAADANFTIGSTPGTIDLTNAAADTMGEVVDFINNLADYKARLICLRRADDADTIGALVAVTSIQAKVAGGLKLAVDTSVCDHVSFSISTMGGSIAAGSASGNTGIETDYSRRAVNFLKRIDATLAYTGADLFRVYEVDDEAKTDELIFQTLISSTFAASTSAGTEEWPTPGLASRPGRRLLVRFSGATTMAITNLSYFGQTINLA